MGLSDWEKLAIRLELPTGAFGDTTATEFMLDVARQAATARDNLAYIERAIKELKRCSYQMESVIDRLNVAAAACRHQQAAFPLNGPKRVDAYWLAEKIARTFRMHGRAVTYGQAPDGETPSTPFCRAVMEAFEILGINGGWRGPAREAWKRTKGRP